MMKKKRAAALLLAVILLLAACSGQREDPPLSTPQLPAVEQSSGLPSPPPVPNPVPSMTEEQQEYYDSYIRPLLYNGMLVVDWTVEEYAGISTAPDGLSESGNLIMSF